MSNFMIGWHIVVTILCIIFIFKERVVKKTYTGEVVKKTDSDEVLRLMDENKEEFSKDPKFIKLIVRALNQYQLNKH